jgi:hypothetical protein
MRRTVSIFLVGVGMIVVATGWALAARHGSVSNVGATGGFLTVTTLVFVISGALITWRAPGRWTGPLVQLVAITTVLTTIAQGNLGSAAAGTGPIGMASVLFPAVLVLDHPDGNREPWLRRMLSAAVIITAGLAVPIALAAHGRSRASTTWWNTDTPHGALPAARALFGVHAAVTGVTLAVVMAAMVVRLVRADRAVRRLLDPVWVPGLAWSALAVAGELARVAGPGWAIAGSGRSYSLSVPALFLFVALPALAVTAVLSGVTWTRLVVPRLRRSASGMEIDDTYDPSELGRYVETALGDPSAAVVFYSTSDNTWFDAAGRHVSIPDDPDRAVLVLRRDEAVLGAIDFDAALAAEPDAVELAVTAAAFAIDSARLVALANASVEEARRLTARLVTSADAARDELRDQLTAGPLRELADIDQTLFAGGDLHEAARRLQAVTAEVRRISHGVFPPDLTAGGLSAALPALPSPYRRFAPAVEVTAYLAAEGDRSASIVEADGRLRIELSAPPTAAGLLDRVRVLGGTIEGSTISLPAAS